FQFLTPLSFSFLSFPPPPFSLFLLLPLPLFPPSSPLLLFSSSFSSLPSFLFFFLSFSSLLFSLPPPFPFFLPSLSFLPFFSSPPLSS
ncbi:hypothetical protein ACXWR7_10865, partial [Streptococcus pyogenes]